MVEHECHVNLPKLPCRFTFDYRSSELDVERKMPITTTHSKKTNHSKTKSKRRNMTTKTSATTRMVTTTAAMVMMMMMMMMMVMAQIPSTQLLDTCTLWVFLNVTASECKVSRL